MYRETLSDPLTQIESASFGAPRGADPVQLSRFKDRATEQLEATDGNLFALELEPGNKESLESVFQASYRIRRAARFLGLEGIQIFCQDLEQLLDAIRNGNLPLQYPVMDCLFDSVTFLKKALADLKPGMSEADDQQAQGQSARLRIRICLLLAGEIPDYESRHAAPKNSFFQPRPGMGRIGPEGRFA